MDTSTQPAYRCKVIFAACYIDAAYWFGKALDTGSAYTNTAAGDDSRQGQSQTEYLVQEDLKQVSDFDQSHALLLRARYQIPRLAGRAASGRETGPSAPSIWRRQGCRLR